ncbi:hypothetical protein J6590_009267 [Homalodisca vitripennis]|nr:hypothetical protein J6590_009267 [Homalodisca vitripennis]
MPVPEGSPINGSWGDPLQRFMRNCNARSRAEAPVLDVRDIPRTGQHVDLDKHGEILYKRSAEAPVLDVRDEPRTGQHVDLDNPGEILYKGSCVIVMPAPGQKPQCWMSGINLALASTWIWISMGRSFAKVHAAEAPVLDVRDIPRTGQHVDLDKHGEILYKGSCVIVMPVPGQKPQCWMSGMNLALASTCIWMSIGNPLQRAEASVLDVRNELPRDQLVDMDEHRATRHLHRLDSWTA